MNTVYNIRNWHGGTLSPEFEKRLNEVAKRDPLVYQWRYDGGLDKFANAFKDKAFVVYDEFIFLTNTPHLGFGSR